MSPPLSLRAQGLGQSVGGRPLFIDLDVQADPGTITAVVGPNGAGKSTLLRKLAGIEAVDRGRVTLGEVAIRDMTARARARRLAYLPQSTSLYHDLRVREIVHLGRAPHLGRFAAPGVDDEAAVERAMARVGVLELQQRALSSLSGGERQRVMLARMLATGAPVLVLDEPTTALDIGHALDFLDLCRALAADQATLVIAMHDLDRAREYADRAVCLGYADGRARVGPSGQVLRPGDLADLFGVEVTEQTRLVFRRSKLPAQ